LRRLAGCVLVALAFAPASAGAETICVRVAGPGCDGAVETEVQGALTRAATHAGADTVRIGPGLFLSNSESGFRYVGIDPITIVGAGAGRTVLATSVATPAAVLEVDETSGAARSATTVSGLTVNGGALRNGGAAAVIQGNVEDASFEGQGWENAASYALRLVEGGTARRISAVARGPFAIGVGLLGPVSVTDSTIAATVGVEAVPSGGGIASVSRTRITATRYGIDACNDTLVAEDSSIETSSIGVEVEGSARCGGENTQFLGRNLTIVGEEGGATGTGLDESGGVTNPSAVLLDSILWELKTSLQLQPFPSFTSTLRVARLSEDTSRRVLGGNGGTVDLADEGGEVGDPKLVDAAHGDLRLGPGSPAIDAGTPGPLLAGESGTDLLGAARVLDGNADGTAVRDIGAIEAPALFLAPPAPIATPVIRDTTAPVLRGVKLVRGRHPRVQMAVSERATVTIALRALPKGCRRASRKCKPRTLASQVAKVGAGTVRIQLGAKLARALARARTLTVTAVDAAGNRSTAKTLGV